MGKKTQKTTRKDKRFLSNVKELLNKYKVQVITTTLAMLAIMSIAIVAILQGSSTKNTQGGISPELAKAMTYPVADDSEKKVNWIEGLEFDAFFLRDIDGDGYAEKIRGTCKEVGKEDTLYMELNVQTEGYLSEAKIEINGNNFYLQTSLPKDEELKDNYIGNNTKTIEFKTINNGTEKLLTGIIRSGDYSYPSKMLEAIGNNRYNYTKESSVVFSGTYIDGSGTSRKFSKTVKFDIDWYGTVTARMYSLNQSRNIEDAIDEENGLINLDFIVNTEETEQELILSKNYVEGKIPYLNGYAPIEVVYTGSNAKFNYNVASCKFTLERSAVVAGSGIVTKDLSRSNGYPIRVVYPIEAYQSLGTKNVELRIPVSTYYEGYNNTSSEFTNPYKSNVVESTIIVNYEKEEEKTEEQIYESNFEVTIGKRIYSPYYRSVISKEKPLKVYNGQSEQEVDDTYIVTWRAYIGTNAKLDGIVMKETKDGETQVTDQFIKQDSTTESTEDVVSNTGIYFGNADTILGGEGWIKVYDENTGNLISTFTKENWNKYTASNPYIYEIPVKHIRVETSNIIKNEESLYVYNVKEIDVDKVIEKYTQEEFDKLQYIKSTLVGYISGEYLKTVTAQANYEEPISIATINLSKDVLSTQVTEKNLKLTIQTEAVESYNQVRWLNGIFLIKFPTGVIDLEINNIQINNVNVLMESYEVIEQNGQKFIKIVTSNEEPQSYIITLDVDISPNPTISTETSEIELYASNENISQYYYSDKDIYDVNNNMNVNEQVNHKAVNISMVSPNSLLTNQIATEYDDRGSKIISPQVADIKPVYALVDQETEQTAKIGVQVRNNYASTISEIQILGKIPFEGNTYVIAGESLGSSFTTTMKNTGIELPAELQGIAKVYYSDNEKPDGDLEKVENNWKEAGDVENWDNIKTYLIDLGSYIMPTGKEFVFNYIIQIPKGVEFNEVSYSHHGIYFSLDTDQGKYRTQTEPNKLGFRIAEKYDLELTKYQTGMDKLVPEATYSVNEVISDEVQENGRTGVTNAQGKLTITNLYAEKTYEIKEIKSPENYELNAETIRFTTNVDDEGNLSAETLAGTTKEDITIQKNTSENYKVLIQVEDEVKASIKIIKKEEGTENAIQGVRFKLTGYDLPQSGKTISTNSDGEATISGLAIEQEYTLQEIKAEGYYMVDTIKFKIMNSNGNYTIQVTSGTVASNQVILDNGIPTINIILKNEKIPTYNLEITKIKKVTETILNDEQENVESQTDLSNAEIEYLQGAKFKLYKGTEEIGEYITDNTGRLTINGLYQYVEEKDIDQTYTLKEVLAPDGYAKVKDISFKVKEEDGILKFYEINEEGQEVLGSNYTSDGSTIKLTIEDSPSFKLVKIDAETKQTIPNVKFAIYNVENGENPATNSKGEILGIREIIGGNEYYTLSTNQNGEITADLAEGLYKAVEVEAPEQYEIEGQEYYFGIGTSREETTELQAQWMEAIYANENNDLTIFKETSDGGYMMVIEVYSGVYDFGNGIKLEVPFYSYGANIIVKYDADRNAEWARTIIGQGNVSINSIIETSKGEYIVIGMFNDDIILDNGETLYNVYYWDAMILKYNAQGILQWGKSIGTNKNDSFESIIEMENGNFLVGGYRLEKMILTEFDNDGNNLSIINLDENTNGSIYALDKTNDGGYIIGGKFSGQEIDLGNGYILTSDVTSNGLLIKYNKEENIEWTQVAKGALITYIKQTSDDGYIVVGSFVADTITLDNGLTFSDNGGNDAILIKYDSKGKTQWAKLIGGNDEDTINSVIETVDGDFILAGEFESDKLLLENGMELKKDYTANSSGMIIKYDKNGKLLLANKIGDSYYSSIAGIIEINEGEYLVGGYFGHGTIFDEGIQMPDEPSRSTAIVNYKEQVKLEFNYDQLKSIGSNGDDRITHIEKTVDGGYILAGSFKSDNLKLGNNTIYNTSVSSLYNDVVFIKYDNNDNIKWIKTLGGDKNESISKLITTKDGGFIVVGSFDSTMVQLGDYILTNSGSTDAMMIKYNAQGEVEWATSTQGEKAEFNGVAETYDGSIIVGGTVTGKRIQIQGQSFYLNDYYTNGVLVKYSEDGKMQWVKAIGRGVDVITPLNDEGYVVSGDFGDTIIQDSVTITPTEYLGNRTFIIKYNKNDVAIWGNYTDGDRGDENIYDIMQTEDDGIIAVGGYSKDVNFGNGVILEGDYGYGSSFLTLGMIVKYDKNGNAEWANKIERNSSYSSTLYDTVQIENKGYLVSGKSQNEGILVFYDEKGIERWRTTTSGASAQSFNNIIQIDDKSFIVTGTSDSEVVSIGDKSVKTNGETDTIILNLSILGEVPEVQELTVENTIKQFQITTDVREINGEKGGTISGEDQIPFETVKYNENSQNQIQIKPKDNTYELISITINGEEYPFETNSDGTYTMPEFTNVTEDKHIVVTFALKTNKLTINKTDAEGKKLQGAIFKIEKQEVEDQEAYNVEVTTDSKGQGIVQLPFGKYKITETKAPEGYILNETPIEIDFTADGEKEITIQNEKYATVLVHHYLKDNTGKYTEIKVAEDELLQGKANENYASTPHLDLEKYDLEKDAKGEYVIPANATGKFQTTQQEVKYYYEEKEIPLTVHHYIEGTTQNVPLKTGTAQDEQKSGKENEEYTTESISNEQLSDKYELVEIPQNANGYYTGDEVIVTYYYKLVTRPLTIIKTGEENQLLEGIKFTIKNTETQNVKEYQTDEEGKIQVTLEAGTYEITETETKDDYQLPQNPTKTITITKNQDTYELNLSNEKKEGTVITHYYIQGTKNKVPSKVEGQVVEDITQTGKVGEIWATKEAENVNDKYELVSVEGETSGEYKEGLQEVIYYYKIKEGTVLVHHYKENTTESLSPDQTIVGALDATYTTSPAEDIPANYELVKMPANYTGTIVEGQTVVTYFYRLKTPDIITPTITKESKTEKVTDKNQLIDYTINYTATIDKYIGDATVTIIDQLPYEIDTSKTYDLDGGRYNNTEKTITWTETINDIDTFANNSTQEINITKEITLVYKDIDVTQANVTNKATGTVKLETPQKEDTKEATKGILAEYLVDVPVKKLWIDNEIQEARRPEKITLILKNGETEVKRQEITKAQETTDRDTWEYTFEDLPKYDALGNEINYTVDEEKTNDFYAQKEITGDMETGYVISNTFTRPTDAINVTVTKVWEDNNNEAKKRPGSIKIQLKNGNNVERTQEINGTENAVAGNSNRWEYTFTGLDKYNENGQEIVYSADETEVNSGELQFYENTGVTGDFKTGLTITNTFTQNTDTIDLKVTKKWVDNDVQAQRRPTSVIIQVKNENEVVRSQEINGTDNGVEGDSSTWEYTFTDLPKYDRLNNIINYTVEEVEKAPGDLHFYTKNIEGTTITNTFTKPIDPVSIVVDKEWIDNSAQAQRRPGSIRIVVKSGAETVRTQEINVEDIVEGQDNVWRAVFTGLDKYDENGQEIQYTVDEEEVTPGDLYFYETAEATGNMETGYVITNTFTRPEDTIDITVNKVWEDNSNVNGKRPDSIRIVVTGDGKTYNQTIEKQEGNTWTTVFADLPKYDNNGKEIEYKVEERETEEGDLYFYNTAEATGSVETGYTITNTFEVPDVRISVSVRKLWIDNETQEQRRPDSITLVLKNGDIEVTRYPMTEEQDGTENNDAWEYTFANLPKYDEAGREIKYTVEEEGTNEFYAQNEITGDMKSGYVIGNTFTKPTDKVSVTVNKVWVDNEAQAQRRPETIRINVLGENSQVVASYDLNTTTETSHTFTELDKYNANGQEITYTVEEEETNEFYAQKDITGDMSSEFTITNTFTKPDDTIDLTVNKAWEDNGNVNGKRPESIELIVAGNGQEYKQTVEKQENNTWTTVFENLPKYNDNGEEIEYTLTEKAVEENDLYFYENAGVTGDVTTGLTITNKFKVPDEKVSVKVTKRWEDTAEQQDRRPSEVTVVLKGNDTTETYNLKEGENWEHTFTNLPKYDEAGNEINYTVDEVTTNEFYTKKDITGDMYAGYVITNTFTTPEETVKVEGTKVWEDNNNEAQKRPTSITMQIKNGNQVVDTAVIDAEENWKHEFTVPKFNDSGDEIKYTVDEVDLGNKFYTKDPVEGNMTDGFVITNRFNVPDEKVEITVNKVWVDNETQAQRRPEKITIKVLGENSQEVASYDLNTTTETSHTFTNLPKYNSLGDEIKYTVDEVEKVADDLYFYEKNVGEVTNKNGEENKKEATITNTFKKLTDTRSLTINKVWNDNEVQAQRRPESIRIVIKNGEEIVAVQEINAEDNKVPEKENQWAVTFTGLDKYNENGQEIKYSVDEEEVNAKDLYFYTKELTDIEDGQATIRNTFKMPGDTVNLVVNKVWNDESNVNGKRPDSIKLVVTGNGKTYIKILNKQDGDTWQTVFENLPKYDEDGQEIEYQVEEVEIEEGDLFFYEKEETIGNIETGYTLTNRFNVPDEKISITINKVWVDSEIQETRRPEGVVLVLNKKVEIEGKETVQEVSRQEITSSNALSGNKDMWQYTFTDLPKYDDKGNIIEYTVEEKQKEQGDLYFYETTIGEMVNEVIEGKITGNKHVTITNTFTRPEDTKDVTVTKVWEDNNDEAKKRPESINIQLKNGNQVVRSQEINAIENSVIEDSNRWEYNFTGLEKYDVNGQEIIYSADESEVNSSDLQFYTKHIEGTQITNTFTQNTDKVDIEVTKKWVDNEKQARKKTRKHNNTSKKWNASSKKPRNNKRKC